MDKIKKQEIESTEKIKVKYPHIPCFILWHQPFSPKD